MCACVRACGRACVRACVRACACRRMCLYACVHACVCHGACMRVCAHKSILYKLVSYTTAAEYWKQLEICVRMRMNVRRKCHVFPPDTPVTRTVYFYLNMSSNSVYCVSSHI